MLQPLGSSTNTSNILFNINSTVSLKGLMIHITGTNTSTAVALADIGRIRLYIRDNAIIDANFDFLAILTNILGGFPASTSTASGAINLSVIIPCGWKDDNILHLDPSDNARFEMPLSSNYASRVSSATITLYGIVEEGHQAYNLTLKQGSESLVASQNLPKVYNHENICAVYCSDVVSNVLTLASSNLARIQAQIGDNRGDSTIEAWLDYTQAKNNLEAAYSLALELFCSDVGDFTSPNKLEDSISLTWVNGSGGTATAQFLLVGMLHNPDKIAQTSLRMESLMNKKLQTKKFQNKDRTIKTIGVFHPTA